MPRGHPDFAKNVGVSQEGEFLPALTIPAIWFKDEFDVPVVKWEDYDCTLTIAVAPVISSYGSPLVSGSSCLKMVTDAAAAAAAYRSIPAVPINSRVGLSVTFTFDAKANFDDIVDGLQLWYLTWRDGTTDYGISISYNPITYEWSVFQGSGFDAVVFATQEIAGSYIHYSKVIFDTETLKYVKFIIDNNEYDLSAYDVYSVAAAHALGTIAYIEATAESGKQVTLWVEDYKMTYGEK